MTSNITAILKIITYVGIFSHLLPLVFFLLFKLHSKEKSLRVIFLYVLYCVFNELLTYYLHVVHPESIFIFFALFTVAELSFFCLFYYYILPNDKVKKFIFPTWLCFILFSLIDFFLINKMAGFDSFTSGLQSILIIGMCIYYLFLQIKGSTNLHIYSTSNFWIIITFLIYLSGLFFLYILTETMINDKAFRNLYMYINSIFNILKNVLLSIAMLMKPGNATSEIKKNYEWKDYNITN